MIKDIEEILTRFEKNKVIINRECSTMILNYVRKELMECYERGYFEGSKRRIFKRKIKWN